MPQLFLMVIVSVAIHLLLGWPLLVGIVIAAAILTAPGLIRLFSQVNDENRPAVFGIALQAIGGTIIASAIAYVGVVLGYFFMGHPSWQMPKHRLQWPKGTHIFGDVLAVATPSATPEILVASTHLLLPTILQVTVPLGLGVRAAAWQLRIEVPNLRKAHLILFLHEGEHLFPN